jgi:pyruvate-formate lyase-activating enzyme
MAKKTQSSFHMLYATPDGGIGESPNLRPIDYDGQFINESDLIPLPDGTTLAMMPGRLAVGLDEQGQRKTISAKRGWAISAFLPIGYTRTRIPGYDIAPSMSIPDGAENLPFFGYTMLVGKDDGLYVTAIQTDDPSRWISNAYDLSILQKKVRQHLRKNPDNRVLQHHAHCALDYRCPTASNLFFERWEGAVAVAGGCNARCIGCISKQEEDGLVSPQDRLTFVPTVEEIVSVGVTHLNTADDSILSFGQGCEGEPLLQARIIESAIRGIRAQTNRGTININTNASNPRAIEKLCSAGLDAMRASTISAKAETYNAYYRPIGYTLEQVKLSLITAREAGIYTSINMLLYPGLNDAEDEAASWVDFLRETGAHLVQLRNLNIDPELLLPKLPPRGKAMGISNFITLLHQELPDLRIGNFTVPVRRGMNGIREPLFPSWQDTTTLAPRQS